MPFTAGPDGAWESDDTTPVYVISVAAELTGLHAQTLRQYDRLGLVSPGRTPGGGRRYSLRDIVAAARGRAAVRRSAWASRGSGASSTSRTRWTRCSGGSGELQQPSSTEMRAARAAQPTALVVWRPPGRR